MVGIDQQSHILRNIFKLQDELKHIDDEENSCLSMALQRSQLKSAIKKKLNLRKPNYYSLANDSDFMDTLTEDHYEKEMRFYEHILAKNINFNNTNQHLFEKLMMEADITNFHEDDDDSFQFQEMALSYLESTNKKNIGNILMKKNLLSIFDEKSSSSDCEYFNDNIVSCYNSRRADSKKNVCLRHGEKVRFISDPNQKDKKKLIVSKGMIKPKENIATDSGKILETEANQILNVDSEKVLESVENKKNKGYSNVLNRKKLLRKQIEKRGGRFNRNSHVGKTVSNPYPRFKLALNRQKAEYSTVIKSNENVFSRDFRQNVQSEKVIELPNNENISNHMAPSRVQTLGKRTKDLNEQTEEKKLKLLNSGKLNNYNISNDIVEFNNFFKEDEEKSSETQSIQNPVEFTLFNQSNDQKNDLNLEIISNQKLQNNCFNLNEVFNAPPKVEVLKQEKFGDNFRNQDSFPFCKDNHLNQISEQATSTHTLDTETSTTHQFFDESTNINSNLFNLPKNIEHKIYRLGDIAGIIVEYTLRRTDELYQNLNKKEQDGKLIVHREALYIKQMLSLLQNVHSELIENTECLLKQKNVHEIPCDLVKYISERNRKILDMINAEQELLKQILYKIPYN